MAITEYARPKIDILIRYSVLFIILLLAVLWMWQSYSGVQEAKLLYVVDMIVLQPVTQSEADKVAREILQMREPDVLNVRWREAQDGRDGSRRADTVLRVGDKKAVADALRTILSSKSIAMDSSEIQIELKKIVRKSLAVEMNEFFKKWSLVMVGPLKYQESNLLKTEETESLRNNPKLDVLFFRLQPVNSTDSLNEQVTDIFLGLFRDTDVTTKKILMY